MGIANHRELASIPDRFRAEHGIAYHVSCHSMSSIGGKFEAVRPHLEQLIRGLAEFARRKAR